MFVNKNKVVALLNNDIRFKSFADKFFRRFRFFRFLHLLLRLLAALFLPCCAISFFLHLFGASAFSMSHSAIRKIPSCRMRDYIFIVALNIRCRRNRPVRAHLSGRAAHKRVRHFKSGSLAMRKILYRNIRNKMELLRLRPSTVESRCCRIGKFHNVGRVTHFKC